MGSGKLADRDLARELETVRAVSGDYAEIGVYRGHLFNRLAWAASKHGRKAHAFDSFEGMAEPGWMDGSEYSRGSMSPGGVVEFQRGLTAPFESYELWAGFIPRCFELFQEYAHAPRFAFAYIDVDHYEPTRLAIEWIWPLISPGGVLSFDDYFPGEKVNASPAIETWLATGPGPVRSNRNRQIFVTKP